MVIKQPDAVPGVLSLTLEPNHSLSLQAQKFVSFFLILIFLMLSAAFAMAGAWVVIPFIGLEVLALLLVVKMVQRYCSLREHVVIEPDRIRVEKRCGRDCFCWGFERQRCSLMLVHDETQTLHHVTLTGEAGLVELGDFLTEADLATLVDYLKRQGVCTRKDSDWVYRKF